MCAFRVNSFDFTEDLPWVESRALEDEEKGRSATSAPGGVGWDVLPGRVGVLQATSGYQLSAKVWDWKYGFANVYNLQFVYGS